MERGGAKLEMACLAVWDVAGTAPSPSRGDLRERCYPGDWILIAQEGLAWLNTALLYH